MNIFGGRPGIAAGVLAVIATLAVYYLHSLLIAAIFAAALIFILICVLLKIKKKLSGYRLFANTVVLSVFLVVLLRAVGIFYGDVPKAHELCGTDVYLHATVRERRTSTDFYTNYLIDIHSVNGIECDLSAELSCEYSSELQKGYEFVLRHADAVYYAELEESEALALVADNIFVSVTTQDPADCAILSENGLTLFDHFEDLNKYLTVKLRNEIRGDEGRLAAAMLLGDKSAIKSETYRDFSRSGLSHYLAVSGLHVSIITGIVGFILLKIGMKRSLRNLSLTVFALAYLFLLGFPISAVRAVIMLLAVFLTYSSGDVADSLNSLGIAASLILIITPTAVFATSFILSFCATLGIVCFMPLLNDLLREILYPEKSGEEKESLSVLLILKKLLVFSAGALMSVSAALSLTLLPTAFLFGEMSRLGFRSNLIASLAVTPMMIALLLYLVIGGVPYIGEGLIFVIRKCAGFMLGLASELGDESGALVSLVSKQSRTVACVFTAVILLLLIIKVKNKKLLLAVPAAYPLVLLLLIFVGQAALPAQTELTAVSRSGSESFLVAAEDGSTVIDVSVGSLTHLRNASLLMRQSGITEIDTLVLTHYHTRHISTVTEFTSQQKVRRVLLPYPETEDDAWIMLQLAESLGKAGIPCELISDGSVVISGGAELKLSPIRRIARSSHPLVSFSVSVDGEAIVYLSSSAWEGDDEEIKSLVGNASTIVFGSHGPVPKSSFDLTGQCEKALNFVIFEESHAELILDNDIPQSERIRLYVGDGVYKISFSGQ